MTKKEWHDELDRHAKFAKDNGWCEQCQHPWHDGMCDCGHADEPEVLKAMELAFAHPEWL